jgi:hypothetical protein
MEEEEKEVVKDSSMKCDKRQPALSQESVICEGAG